jgi:L-alanine-DL-glutamate epimerase-like enolase superfamily enzyme
MERRHFLKTIAVAGVATAADAFSLDPRKAHGQVDSPGRAKSGATGLDPSLAKKLAEHRIARMDAQTLTDRYPRSVGRNSKGNPTGRGGTYQVRTVVTDQGVRGWAMSYMPDEKVRHLIGARISDLFDLVEGTSDEAVGIELPLYDLAGQILGKQVYALLGSRGPREVPIYSGAIYLDDLEPPEKPRGVAGVLASCQQDYESGYRAFKLKIGRGLKWIPGEEGWRRDIEVTRAVRERFPDCRILVDANDAYTCDGFCNYLSAVSDCDLYCIEEPFAENHDDLARLHEHMAKVGSKALIVDGEGRTDRAEKPWRYGGYSSSHIERLFALAKEKLVDVFNLDLGIVGFTNWRKIMPELVDAGVQASPHTWMWTPRPYYSAQLAAGLGNTLILEGIPGRPEKTDFSAYRFVAGRLVVPEAPGFGLSLKDGQA